MAEQHGLMRRTGGNTGCPWVLCVWQLAVLFAWTAAFGQGPLPASPRSATNNASEGGSTKTTEARLAEARARLVLLGNVAGTNLPADIPQQDVSIRRAGLQRLVRLYEQQLSKAAALEKAKARRAEVSREAQAWTGFAEPPPYSILLTDRLHEEVQAEQQNLRSAQAAITALEQLIEESRGELARAEEQLRQINEQLEVAKEPTAVSRLSWQREMQRLRSQVASASVATLDSERLLNEETIVVSRTRLGLLQRQLVFAENGVTFTEADLETVKRQIDGKRQQLEQELAQTEKKHSEALQGLDSAREQLRQVQSRAPEATSVSLATEWVTTRQTQLELAETTISLLRMMLEAASVERTMWELRFAASGTRSVSALRDSEQRLVSFERTLQLWREYLRQQQEASGSQLQLQEALVNALAPDSALGAPARERLAALQQRELILMRMARTVAGVVGLAERWAEGLRDSESRLPFTGRARNVFSDARQILKRLWNFEVFTAEDTITVDGQQITGKRSVTVGKVILAITILGVGIWLSGWGTRLIQPLLVKRLKVEVNQAALIGRWVRALLIALLVLFSLVSVKIPLTVFAFAGGALAIALGFGMQTILKNFVSGVILLFERPFRVGDVLDVAGQKGVVTGIGLRASVLQLWDGTETLIPNSSLLESNVTNWTYSNRKVRFAVTAGAAYGSDPRLVVQLLKEAAERHGLVAKEPTPQVLFTEFGESTLNFELRFWVDVTAANAAQVSSDLRLMIVNSFLEHGIVIAYPQRDLHLHADNPVPVQVVTRAEPQGEISRESPCREQGDKPRLMP